MPIRGSRPYLIRRQRRRVAVIAWAILLVIALVAVGLAALATPAIVGFCGYAAETGYWYYRERDLQAASDIASYDGAMALRGGASLSSVTDTATSASSTNGWRSGQGTITVHSPPTSGPNQNNHSVEVLLTENEPRFFTGIFFSGTVPVNVRAVGTFVIAGQACMLGLDKTRNDTVQFWGNADANFASCYIASNSSASTSFAVGGSARVTVPCVNAVGDDQVSNGLTLTSCSSVTTHAAPAADPYASLGSPTPGACFGGGIGATLSPATYCGGLTLQGTQTLSAGVYIISGGTLKINANAVLTGTGITFYLTNGANLQINGGAVMNLSAPTTGPYAGVLFYGDRTQAYASNTINGDATSLLTGAIYFPSQAVNVLGNFSGAGGCMQVVADTIYYTGSSTFTTNCSGAGMSTINVPGAVSLVE